MEQKAKIKLTIDGNEVMAAEGATILDAARQNGIHIPTLCHHPAVSNWGGCRLCVVEVDKGPKLVASCVMPVRPGMEIVTTNERILESRRIVLEYLFSERNHNCMFCPQSGDCELQKLGYEMRMDHVSVPFSFNSYPTDVTSENMVMDHNRCVLCGRCVRACAELAGNYVLNFQNRGPRNLIGLDLNESREDSSCLGCGLCMQVCPTGAITSRRRSHYSVLGHESRKEQIDSVCTHCGLLCPTTFSVSANTLVRVDGNTSGGNGRPDRGQLCYKGRFEVFKEQRRLVRPMVRGADGKWKEEGWEKALGIAADRLGSLKKEYGGKSLVGVASSTLSNEELFLFKEFMEGSLEAGYLDTLDGRHYRSILKGVEVLRVGRREAHWSRIAEADFVLLVGGDPFETQPLLASLIRKGVLERGLKVAVAGTAGPYLPIRTLELGIQPGNEVNFMEAFLASVLEQVKDAPGDPKERESAEAGIAKILKSICPTEEAAKKFGEMVDAFLSSGNPFVIAGPSLTLAPEGMHLVGRISMLKGLSKEKTQRFILLKKCGNAAGAWRLRIPSGNEAGPEPARRGALVLMGGERDPHPLPEFLGEMEFLAVVTPYFQEDVAEKAHLMLPRPSWAEGEGTFASLDGRESAFARRILDPPEGVRDAWKILVDLAKASGSALKQQNWDQVKEKAERAFLTADQA